MLWRSILIVWVCLLAYVLLGAAVFHVLEHPQEKQLHADTHLAHIHFLGNNTCLDSDDLEVFVRRVVESYKMGVMATANHTSESNWDFYSALFFTVTVVTTIGYGNIAPTTLGGQIFCIFFAIGGIPLCTVLLASIGQKLRYPILRLKQVVVSGRSGMVGKCVKVFLAVFIGDLFMILLPSIMFSLVEGWNYGVSVYYSFVTLTTIGFGDYVAGIQAVPYRGLYRVVCGVWVIFGLAWVAAVVGEIAGDLTSTINKKEDKCVGQHNKANTTSLKTCSPVKCEEIEMTGDPS